MLIIDNTNTLKNNSSLCARQWTTVTEGWNFLSFTATPPIWPSITLALSQANPTSLFFTTASGMPTDSVESIIAEYISTAGGLTELVMPTS